MSKVIAVLGGGTGLGLSMARRFGREGFRVALVARRRDRLDALVATLADEGIDATAFEADLAVPVGAAAVVGEVTKRLGRVDVIAYGPASPNAELFVPAATMKPDVLERWLPLLLLSPVAIVQAVQQQWIARGDGALLVTHGASAVVPMHGVAGVGTVMAATRHYLHALHDAWAPHGLFAGSLAVTAVIGDSEMIAALQSDGTTIGDGSVVDPARLAEQYWEMYVGRSEVERVFP